MRYLLTQIKQIRLMKMVMYGRNLLMLVHVLVAGMVISTNQVRANSDSVTEDIHAIISEELSTCAMKNKMGFGVAVIANNRLDTGLRRNLTFTTGYNYRDLEKRTYADENSMFCIGSITKLMSATLLVHLVDLTQEKGYRYTMQTLVTELDPSLGFSGSQFIGVTLEDVLSHRAGISDYGAWLLVGNPRNTTRKHSAWTAARAPRLFPNRAYYMYNNNVFGTAGYFAEILAEKLLGRFVSWEDLMDLYFFKPMGISDDVDMAGYNFTSFSRLSFPYLTEKGRYRAMDPETLTLVEPIGPSGAACFTPKSMSVWMQLMLDRGQYKSRQLISRKTLEDTWKSRISLMEIPPRYPTQNLGNRTFTFTDYQLEMAENGGYGLGWVESRYRGHRYLWHDGGYNSYLSLYSMLPDQNISIFTSSAGPLGDTESLMQNYLHYRLFDYLLNLAPLNPAGHICPLLLNLTSSSTAAPVTNITENVNIDAKFYVGAYYHPVHGVLRIEHGYNSTMHMLVGREGNATIVCTTSAGECSLRFNGMLWWVSESDGYASPSFLAVVFHFSDAGFVTSVTLPLYSYSYVVPPLFERVSTGI